MSCFKTASDDTFTTYTYDSNGNRIRSEVNGNAVNYLIDESFVYPQVVSEYDDLGTVTTEYHRGLGLISMYNGINERFYRYDALGSVRALSDGNSVTDTYDYDAYGEIRTRTGTTENSFMFTGEQYDEETGNYYLRARYYNPSSGQFISRDSWEGDDRNPITLNKYAYANSNPVMYTDPSGKFAIFEIMWSQAIVETMASTAVGVPRGIPSPEQTAKSDKTELFKNRYYAFEEHAAWDPTNFINPVSVRLNWEFGGAVVQLKGSLLFYATVPMLATKNNGKSCDPEFLKPDVSVSGNIWTAMYHTHGAPGTFANWKERCEKAPLMTACKTPYGDPFEMFSNFPDGDDIEAFKHYRINGYLGTPRGWFWKYDHKKGVDFIPKDFPRVSSPYFAMEAW
jgi:RHS repeat-associated protein